ncbi:MAG: hypothetical protein V7607_2155 [Solirubrobacteraceae bacterium]
MSAYVPHPLVVAVAGGVVDNGARQADAERFAATWPTYDSPPASTDKVVAALVDGSKAVAKLAEATEDDADAVAHQLTTCWQADPPAAIGDHDWQMIPEGLLDQLEKAMVRIGTTLSTEDDVQKGLGEAVGAFVATWWSAAPPAVSGEDLEVVGNARRLADEFIDHADAAEALTVSGYLGGSIDDRQFFYLEPTLQAWLLIQADDIVSMVRVPDDKQPFGCKPDAIWVKGYAPVIHSDVKLTKQAIAARILSRDFTTAAVAIDTLTRGRNAAPGITFGEDILGHGFSNHGWWCLKGGGR